MTEVLLNPREASIYLGVKQDTLAVWRVNRRYDLPYIKVGRLIKYRLSDLDNWLRDICDDAYAQTIIQEFKDDKSNVNIAISVDMMDTGIDVPEIVNLVFFKKVKSKAKFWQMIGRGTRLCKGLNCADGQNGSYEDKKYFYIFDYLGNFEFFRAYKNGIEGNETQSLSEAIFSRKVKLIYQLQDAAFNTEDYQKWRDTLVDEVYTAISGLEKERVDVRRERKYLEQFKDKKSFEVLSEDNCADLAQHIAPLIIQIEKDENAQQFDNFMYGLMLARLENAKSQNTYVNKLVKTAVDLTKKTTIPQIKARIEFIKQVADVEVIKQADKIICSYTPISIMQYMEVFAFYLVDMSNKQIVYSFALGVSDYSTIKDSDLIAYLSWSLKNRFWGTNGENENLDCDIDGQKIKCN